MAVSNIAQGLIQSSQAARRDIQQQAALQAQQQAASRQFQAELGFRAGAGIARHLNEFGIDADRLELLNELSRYDPIYNKKGEQVGTAWDKQVQLLTKAVQDPAKSLKERRAARRELNRLVPGKSTLMRLIKGAQERRGLAITATRAAAAGRETTDKALAREATRAFTRVSDAIKTLGTGPGGVKIPGLEATARGLANTLTSQYRRQGFGESAQLMTEEAFGVIENLGVNQTRANQGLDKAGAIIHDQIEKMWSELAAETQRPDETDGQFKQRMRLKVLATFRPIMAQFADEETGKDGIVLAVGNEIAGKVLPWNPESIAANIAQLSRGQLSDEKLEQISQQSRDDIERVLKLAEAQFGISDIAPGFLQTIFDLEEIGEYDAIIETARERARTGIPETEEIANELKQLLKNARVSTAGSSLGAAVQALGRKAGVGTGAVRPRFMRLYKRAIDMLEVAQESDQLDRTVIRELLQEAGRDYTLPSGFMTIDTTALPK